MGVGPLDSRAHLLDHRGSRGDRLRRGVGEAVLGRERDACVWVEHDQRDVVRAPSPIATACPISGLAA